MSEPVITLERNSMAGRAPNLLENANRYRLAANSGASYCNRWEAALHNNAL
jgi:hypothetical protein